MSYNILQIIPEIDIGGAERTTLEIADAIVKDGGNSYVLTNGGSLQDAIEESGSVVINADVKTKNPFKILFSNKELIKSLIKKYNIDIVHARSRAPAISAYYAAKEAGVHFITTYHGIYKANNPIKRWYNSFMARGEIVIANSEFTKTHIIAEHQIPESRIIVVYRGVDLDIFNPQKITAAAQSELIGKWGLLGRDLPKIMLAGRLTEWKGQRVLIDAANILKQKGINADYIFVGSSQGRDEYVEELKSLISQYGLSENFHFVGRCNDMPTAYEIADIVAAPSIRPEAFGRTAAEAEAMGKPVIASRLGGAMETVEDTKTGFLINVGDANDLAQKINTLLTMSPENIAIIGKQAQSRVEKMFSTASLQKETLSIYHKLIKR